MDRKYISTTQKNISGCIMMYVCVVYLCGIVKCGYVFFINLMKFKQVDLKQNKYSLQSEISVGDFISEGV
jgi:hypothetical protein